MVVAVLAVYSCWVGRGTGGVYLERGEVEVKEMSEATEIVHWPGKDVPACYEHAAKLKALAQAMGFSVSSTPWPAGGTCKNCENESRKP